MATAHLLTSLSGEEVLTSLDDNTAGDDADDVNDDVYGDYGIIVLVVILIVFGAGKLPQVLGQMGKGVKAFKDGMQEDPNKAIDTQETNTEEAKEDAYVDAEEIHR